MAAKRWTRDVCQMPLDLQSSGKSRVVRDQNALASSREDSAQALMLLAIRLIEGLALFGIEQTRYHPDGARGIKHVHGALAELGGDLHGRMLCAGRRTPDQ